jgi:hypothetical protein
MNAASTRDNRKAFSQIWVLATLGDHYVMYELRTLGIGIIQHG